MTERTLILIKPDAVRRGLTGQIVARIENKGLKIVGLKMLRFSEELADAHYAEHIQKDFYPALKKFIVSGPCVALAVQGDQAVAAMRALMGATKFIEAAPGTIRGDYAFSVTENLIHGSDSVERAKVEAALFFGEGEIFE